VSPSVILFLVLMSKRNRLLPQLVRQIDNRAQLRLSSENLELETKNGRNYSPLWRRGYIPFLHNVLFPFERTLRLVFGAAAMRPAAKQCRARTTSARIIPFQYRCDLTAAFTVLTSLRRVAPLRMSTPTSVRRPREI